MLDMDLEINILSRTTEQKKYNNNSVLSIN